MDDAAGNAVDWRDLAGAIPGPVAVQNDGEFVYVTDGFADAVGVDRAELVGRGWRDLFEDGQFEQMREAVATARADSFWEGTIRTRGLDNGGERGLTISASDRDALLWQLMDDDRDARPEAPSDRSGTAARDGTGRELARRERTEGGRFVRNIVDALDDVLYVVDEDGEFAFWNEELRDRFGYDDEAMPDLDPHVFLPPAQRDELPVKPEDFVGVPDRHNVVDLVTKAGEPIPHEIYGRTFTDDATGERYRVGVARDVRERLERERELERQRDELATLDRINRLLLETVQELIEAGGRDAVETTVCERLAASDLYQFAWVGERELDGDRIVPRTTAGEDEGYVETITVTDGEGASGNGPAGRAMRTGEVQVMNVDDPGFAPWREAARERDVESVAAVPLQHGDAVYGVLVVYATREDAFSPREQPGFDALGRTVGLVVNAARSRNLLVADSVVELTFRIDTGDNPFVRAAADRDCTLSLAGYVSAGDRWILYFGVEDADPADVVTTLEGEPRIDRARTITGRGDGRVEAIVPASPLLDGLTDAGATVATATVDATGTRVVVEAPAEADIRGIVDQVRTASPDTSLLASRECDREVATRSRPGGLLDELTDRQREVLEAAYRAGYYAWPRESTAEEVAAALDLAGPTFHGHLRKAERAMLSQLFE